MKMNQLNTYSDKLLSGKHMKSLLVCLMLIGTLLFFRLAEAMIYSVTLYIGAASPAGLFTGENPLQLGTALILTLLRYIACAPVSAACAYWFSELCCETEKKRSISVSRILMNPIISAKNLCGIFISKILGAAALIPAVFFARTAYFFILDNSLFMAFHAAAITLIAAAFWLRIKLTMFTLPLLIVKFPEISVIRLTLRAFRLMRSRRASLLFIILRYGITLRLPKLFTASALFISISLKEDEYLETTQLHRGHEQTNAASKFSHGEKRRITPASDPTQAAGYGDNP